MITEASATGFNAPLIKLELQDLNTTTESQSTAKDHFTCLPLEIRTKIFLFYIANKLNGLLLETKKFQELLRLKTVCKGWRDTVNFDSLWRQLLVTGIFISEDKADELDAATTLKQYHMVQKRTPRLSHQVASLCPNAFQAFKDLYRASRSGDLTMNLLDPKRIRAVEDCSSCDHPSQSILQTVHPDPSTFWSSKGSPDPNGDEFLQFCLSASEEAEEAYCCLVESIHIKPFEAHYQKGLPTYSPLSVSISFSKSAFPANSSSLPKDFFFYTTQKYTLFNKPDMQVIKLPFLVPAYSLRINLHGHATNQAEDGLFYTAIERVEAKGAPVFAFESSIVKAVSLFTTATNEEQQVYSEDIKRDLQRQKNDYAAGLRFISYMRIKSYQLALPYIKKFTESPLLRSDPFFSAYADAVNLATKYDPLAQTLFGGRSNSMQLFKNYFGNLFRNRTHLTRDEGLLLARLSRENNEFEHLRFAITHNMIYCTTELASIFEIDESLPRTEDNVAFLEVAFGIYHTGHVFEKTFFSAVALEKYSHASQVFWSLYREADLVSIIQALLQRNHARCLNFLRHFHAILLENHQFAEEEWPNFLQVVKTTLSLPDDCTSLTYIEDLYKAT